MKLQIKYLGEKRLNERDENYLLFSIKNGLTDNGRGQQRQFYVALVKSIVEIPTVENKLD